MSNKIKLVVLMAMTFVAFIVVVFTFSSYSILTLQDYLYWYSERKNVAIHIPGTGEKYYNEWKCFKLTNVKISEVTLDYSTLPRVLPALEVKEGQNVYEFDIDPTYNWNNNLVISKWKHLIKNEYKLCIFSAYLQKDSDLTSVWMISKLKTKVGYWNISEYAQYLVGKE